MSSQKAPVSPVIEFIKVFNEMSARYGRSELWYDYIDMHAIALANTCDLRCRDAREEQYHAIVQKYDENTVQQFAVLTAITMTALLENPEQDFLGTVYHNLGLSKSQAGQFFTPYNVGQMMARIQHARFTMDGEEFRQYVMELDRHRRALHEGLMARVNFANRLCVKLNTPVLAERVTEEDRETYFAFAKEVVDSYFGEAMQNGRLL